MLSDRQLADLVALVRRRYPAWQDFEHPQYLEDERLPKQAAVEKAQTLLSQDELDRLLAEGGYETILEHVERLSRLTNLMWRRVPRQSDVAVLYDDGLNVPLFCTEMRNLLYGDRAAADRLQSFVDYLQRNNLPNKWPFPTYCLFFCHPQTEIFVKPRTAQWFLRYMGFADAIVSAPPDAGTYQRIVDQAAHLLEQLRPYGIRDMVDVQSFIWICAEESKARTGRLDARGQVELDVPRTEPENGTAGADYQTEEEGPTVLRESSTAVYETALQPVYPLKDVATNTGHSLAQLQQWLDALRRKGQAILYGPPGTGKTFLAQHLARHLTGGGDGFWQLVQFHPAYAYEDFIQGIRPVTQADGTLRYELLPGRFLQFCALARERADSCVLVIDEINRANISSVFGELMFLLEYRDASVPLAGGGQFAIPKNVLIIGTMNTADRSIALVDYALRRRFAFIHLTPSEEVLRRFHAHTEVDVENLIVLLRRVNRQIGDPHYFVGHSFFLRQDLKQRLPEIWRLEIEPYLEEYFYDQPEEANVLRWERVQDQLGYGND